MDLKIFHQKCCQALPPFAYSKGKSVRTSCSDDAIAGPHPLASKVPSSSRLPRGHRRIVSPRDGLRSALPESRVAHLVPCVGSPRLPVHASARSSRIVDPIPI